MLGPVFTSCALEGCMESFREGERKHVFHPAGRDRCFNFAYDVFYNMIVVSF